jgi:phosphomevalonate kinase
MSAVVASAPGKLVLCGEYVVLDGAPALSLAINRRATVTLKARHTAGRQADTHRVNCPGYDEITREFRVTTDNVFDWVPCSSALPDYSLLELAWQASDFRPGHALDLTLDSREFVDCRSGLKLGIGSSASLLVALLGAFGELDAQPAEPRAAIEIHRLFQGGRGSGIDVATAFHGGLIHYRSGATPACEALTWPTELAYAVLWSGVATDTASKLRAYPGAHADAGVITALHDVSTALVAAWPAGNAGKLLGLLTDYIACLAEFDQALGLGILEGGHAGPVTMAADYGVAYKPSGAGGGDVGIALAADPDRLQAFVDAATTAGFSRLHVGIDETGLRAATCDP